MNTIKRWLTNNWRMLLIVMACVLVLLAVYGFRLNGLTGGLSPIEKSYVASTSFIRDVLSQSVFLPHKFLSFIAANLSDKNQFARVPSVLFAVISIICFYALMARWYTRRIALMTTLLFITSSWTLTIGRQALPTISYLGWLPILALLYWTVSEGKHKLAVLFWAFTISLAFYVPGLLWFVVVLATSQRKRLQSLIISTPGWQIAIAGVLSLILLVPFFYSMVQSPLSALASLGLPTTMEQITSAPYRLLQIFIQVFIYSSANAVFHLGHLSYLDITSGILFLLGIYRLRYSSARKMMAWSGLVALGWLVGAALGAINIAIFLPLIYMFVGGGLSFLLVQWLKVFPRNPIARGVGISLVIALVVFISFYHLNRYFIAWPHNPVTKQVFSAGRW